MKDMIYRQDAIDAIERTYGSLSYQCDGFTRGDAIDILNSLPSAQPDLQQTCNKLANEMAQHTPMSVNEWYTICSFILQNGYVICKKKV